MNNKANHSGQTALITGATSGIGLELSRIFAQQGFNLVLTARNEKRLEDIDRELSNQYSIQCETIAIDLSLASAPQSIAEHLQCKSIHVDILVNNAGFNEYGLFTETDLSRELEMIQLNVASLTGLTKLLLPGMTARKYGRILNVGSTGSFAPGPFNAVYCATKAYILSFTEALAEELKGSGVTATALCPGATKTEFARRANMEDSRIFQGYLLNARKVAEEGYNALMKGQTVVIPDCRYKLMISSLRLVPRKCVARIAKNLMKRTC